MRGANCTLRFFYKVGFLSDNGGYVSMTKAVRFDAAYCYPFVLADQRLKLARGRVFPELFSSEAI